MKTKKITKKKKEKAARDHEIWVTGFEEGVAAIRKSFKVELAIGSSIVSNLRDLFTER